VRIDLDLGQVREIHLDAGARDSHRVPQVRGLSVSSSDEPLLEAVARLVALLETPRDIRVMASLVLREVAYPILMGEQGPSLRQIASEGG
jgi:hypothetical protein